MAIVCANMRTRYQNPITVRDVRIHMTHSKVLLATVALMASACPTMITVDGISVPQDEWAKAEAEVRARAKSDFACEDVKLTLLKIHPAGSPTTVGAAGCEKTGTYVRGESGWAAAPQ
jgi:hypothetical protein